MRFKILKTSAFSLLICLFASCTDTPALQFEKTDEGMAYKFIRRDETADSTAIGSTVEIDVKYYDKSDSLLFDSDELSPNFRIRIKTPSSKSSSNIDNALLMMHEGDSAIFMLDAYVFYIISRNLRLPRHLEKGDVLRFHIALKKVFSQAEIDSIEQAQLEVQKKEEYDLLKDYISLNHPNITETISGLYFEETAKGAGPSPTAGDSVVVHYEGRFLNGEYFGSSIAKDKPLGFVLGHSFIIPAWEEALAKMNKGGKATIIAPSHLAYGDKGNGQMIGPYTSLIFNIELLEIYPKK